MVCFNTVPSHNGAVSYGAIPHSAFLCAQGVPEQLALWARRLGPPLAPVTTTTAVQGGGGGGEEGEEGDLWPSGTTHEGRMAARLRVSTGKRHLGDIQRMAQEISQLREELAKQQQELDGGQSECDSEGSTASDHSPRESSPTGTPWKSPSRPCRGKMCRLNRKNLRAAQEVIDQLNAKVKATEEQLSKFQAAVKTNIVEGMDRYTAGLNTKQSKAPLEDDGKPLPSFEEVLTKVKLTMTENYEICPICGSMTSDLCDHLGREKTMAVKVPLAGVPGMTELKTVPLHYFCPDPSCKFHDVTNHHRTLEEEDNSDDEKEKQGHGQESHSTGDEQHYLTKSLYEHYLECHILCTGADGGAEDEVKQRASCELVELRRKAVAAKIAAGDANLYV